MDVDCSLYMDIQRSFMYMVQSKKYLTPEIVAGQFAN